MSTGVQTNGIGKPTTNHLNLTRSLADVWRVSPAELAQIRTKLHGGPARPVEQRTTHSVKT